MTNGRMAGKGARVVPSNPLGRLVAPVNQAKQSDAVAPTHWCPKEGVRWECPECGAEFIRDEDRRGIPWRAIPVDQSDGPVIDTARAGQSVSATPGAGPS